MTIKQMWDLMMILREAYKVAATQTLINLRVEKLVSPDADDEKYIAAVVDAMLQKGILEKHLDAIEQWSGGLNE